jgi:chromosome segregation protein
MHLKTLEIQGFKSFPERTVIDFHPGVTAIIGPNGSGKSNVTDAIRWVLGEQSVKTLRGARMEDVIFTGTQSRRAMSYAEVTITFDNSDRGLPVEYTELQVTRRLYRSGDSEYFLNKTNCRLRDIASLFMDTGLGRDGYSIVGQGRVDDILSHRSEDRRKIFEEASGIVKFKTRKEESERKLQQTEQNLLRINDIIQELGERIEPLAQQAEIAKQFMQLSDSLKTLDIALMLDTIDQNQTNIEQTRQEKMSVEDDLGREQEQLARLRDDHRAANEAIRNLENQIEEHRANFNSLNAMLGSLSSKKAANLERTGQLRRRIEQSGQVQKELLNQLQILNMDLGSRAKKAETLARQKVHFENQLRDAEERMQSVMTVLSDSERQVETYKSDMELQTEAIYDQKNTLGQLRSQLPLIDNRQKALTQNMQSLVSDKDRHQLAREEAGESLSRVLSAEQQQIQVKLTLQTEMEQTRLQLQKTTEAAELLNQKIRNGQFRLQTLVELERNHEGYTDTVKRLMQQAASDESFGQGIVGTLGELLQVDKQFELAIETALGPAVSNIVTDTESTASRLIQFLKETRAGRATFLPVATVRGRKLDANLLLQLKGMPGYLGVASDRVVADPSLAAILDSLLGRIIIAESLSQATVMARKIQYNCRFVTLEGDVVNPGGSLTGGYNRKGSSGVLGRAREIELLHQQLADQKEESQSQSQARHATEAALQDQARRLATIDHQLLQLSHQKIRDEAQLQAIEEQFRQNALVREREEAESLALTGQRDLLKQQISHLEQTVYAAENDLAELRRLINQQEVASKAEQQRRDDLREEVSDLRISMHSIEESMLASTEILARMDSEKRSLETRQLLDHSETAENESEIQRLAEQTLELDVQITNAHNESQELAQQVRLLNQQREALETQQARFFDTLETQAARISTLQTEIARIQGRFERYEAAGDEAKNRLWETYELTVQTAEKWRQPIDSRPEATRKVSSLRNQIKSLGSVNLAAVDEYQAVHERFEFMGQQRDDIEASRQKLFSVINDLTEAMKRQFVEHFSLINENFKLVFAELFGGGMAEIQLENQDDVLNCGIEIKAQPPGKKLQSLLLLSGGERCLTAIALLFAILKLRPTPFCVLDEVEAALDDANVVKFSEYIRRYADDSQFILVTHRKGTMEAADRLYGVTMQERGISRILSMQLSE